MHEIRYLTFEKASGIQPECDEICRENSDWGSTQQVRFPSVGTFETREEAHEYLDNRSKEYSYYSAAVQFYDKKPNAKVEKLQADIQEARKKLHDIDSVLYAKTVKAKLITCGKCESKLSTEYLKANRCPICFTDLRSTTTLERLERLKNKIADLEEKERIERSRQSSKGCKTMWLVRLEYHT